MDNSADDDHHDGHDEVKNDLHENATGVELFGSMNDGPAVIDNQTRDPKTMTRSQSSISAGHELQVGEVVCL